MHLAWAGVYKTTASTIRTLFDYRGCNLKLLYFLYYILDSSFLDYYCIFLGSGYYIQNYYSIGKIVLPDSRKASFYRNFAQFANSCHALVFGVENTVHLEWKYLD